MEASSIEARAAWLYYIGGLTQSEVAHRLGISSVKAHRLITRARNAGLVRVTVYGSIGNCIALEAELQAKYGIAQCRVVLDLEDNGIAFRAIGAEAAAMLAAALEAGQHRVIGFGHGRSVASAVAQLPQLTLAHDVSIISLLGGVPHQRRGTAFNVIYGLAEKTGAEAWVMPVPLFANSQEDAAILRRQRGIAEALQLAGETSLSFVGIGEVSYPAFLAATNVIGEADVRSLLGAGAVAEVLGNYYDSDGKRVDTAISQRVVAVDPAELAGRGMVAIAGGQSKTAAIRAILRAGFLTGLITDESTARLLLES